MIVPLLLTLAGCGSDDAAADRRRYVAALASGDCAGVQTPDLRDDCALAAAGHAAEPGTSAEARHAAVCGAVSADAARDECAFLVAERYRAPSLCRQAGRYADDCALHVVSAAFAVAKAPTEAWAAEQIAASGLAPDDPRPWSAYYRDRLGRSAPLDRAACAALDDAPARPDRATRAEACRQTALAVFDDRLNAARDRRRFRCEAGVVQPPLPALVQWVPDPDLDAAWARRTDLCTPMDAPPGGPR